MDFKRKQFINVITVSVSLEKVIVFVLVFVSCGVGVHSEKTYDVDPIATVGQGQLTS